MTSSEVVPMAPSKALGTNTYGCLDPIEITGLDALLDDIRRTYAHVMWLEHYIAEYLGPHDPFSLIDLDMQAERERMRVGKPTVVGSVKWQLEMQRRKQINTKHQRLGTHPAISQLMNERRHLADVSYKAMILGIKLDSIDYSRKQADLIITAMGKFAITQGLKPTDPLIAQAIVDALEAVLAEQRESGE